MNDKIIFAFLQSKRINDVDINESTNQNYPHGSENFISIDENIEDDTYLKRKSTVNINNISKNKNESIDNHNLHQNQRQFTETNNIIFPTSITNIEMTPNQNYDIEENPSPNEPKETILPIKNQFNNAKLFYKYNLKSLIIFLIYLILLKYLQNIFSRYCFADDGCDCSDNSLIIKIWSMILVQHFISHIIWMIYLFLPELKETKSLLKYQLLVSSLVCIALAFVLNGQSQILVELRTLGAAINIIVHSIIGIYFMKKINRALNFLKTNIANIIFISFFSMMAVNYIRNIKEVLNDLGDYADLSFAIFITTIRILYKNIFNYLLKNFNQRDDEDINEKYIIMSDIFSMPIFGFEIGIMFRDTGTTWNYYFYLLLSQLNSIELQTSMLKDLYIKVKICFQRVLGKNLLAEYSQIEEKDLVKKVVASRKIIYTGLAYINLISFYFTQQWMEYYNNNTQGCLRGIPDYILSKINSSKLLLFILINSFIDIACYYYNKKNNFNNVILFVSKRNYISFGISLYISSLLLEAVFQKALFIL